MGLAEIVSALFGSRSVFPAYFGSRIVVVQLILGLAEFISAYFGVRRVVRLFFGHPGFRSGSDERPDYPDCGISLAWTLT